MSEIPERVLEKIQEAKERDLTKLDLRGYFLTALPESLGELQGLTTLDLSFNRLTELPEWMGQLQGLTQLYLSNNSLTELPEWMGQLQGLTTLDLSGLGLTELPEWMGQLQGLTTLDLSYNSLTELPESLGELQGLTTLNLSGLGLTELPEWMGQLQGLTTLDLSNNPIDNIPPEVLGSGYLFSDDIEKIRAYFRQLEAEGQDYLYEAKLLIVGEGGAGKTTLAKKIKDPNYELREDEESTEGIEVIQWGFKMENGQPFRVNIWDFGGQEIYHATHQFFLTKRSLYAVVADSRKEDTDFNYWLNIVGLLSDNSPLLIVKNEKQDRQRAINERQLRGQFINLKETLATNLATNRGLPEIVDEIKHYICRLPHIGTALPKTWVEVRKALENDDRDYISLNEYLDLCGQKGFKLKKDKLQLIEYLHDLGVCLHFQKDPLLKKTLILKPKWGTDAVYKVLVTVRRRVAPPPAVPEPYVT